MSTWRFVAVLIFLIFVGPVSYVHAEGCGTITGPQFHLSADAIFTYPITDCQNPFGVTDEGVPGVLRIEGTVVEEGATVLIPPLGTTAFQFDSDTTYSFAEPHVYRHDGNSYTYVSLNPPSYTEAEYRAAADDFFPPEIDVTPYIEAFLNNDSEPFPDDEESSNRYGDLLDYLYSLTHPQPPLLAGTYTMVVVESMIYNVEHRRPWWEWLVATAHAHGHLPNRVTTLTFTLAPEEPSPTGASSVLFLPGVMGSRLFEVTNACAADGEEHEVWVDSNECFQARMSMSSAGESINPLYTYVGRRGLVDEAYTLNYYKSFVNSLDDWRGEGIIADYAIVPYDWRLKLSDTLLSWRAATTDQLLSRRDLPLREQHLYKTLAALASTSLSSKVTLVAHSNGGLVAKQFLIELEEANDPLLAKIDNLILVAVPQVGTPEALISLLHGTDLGLGFVLDEEMSRRLLTNMPMGYHLLPNQEYFDGQGGSVSTPVIDFEAGASTTAWRDDYGDITDRSTLHRFLGSSSGRSRALDQDLVTPQLLNDELLAYAREIEEKQAAWQPPQTLEVYQIAGVGLSTPAKITYTTVRVCAKFISGTCIQYLWEVRPQIRTVIDGDETVVTPSALALTGNNVERWWLNLFEYNDDNAPNRKHSNILEVVDLISFVENTINSASFDETYNYLTKTQPDFTGFSRLTFQLHSPLDLSIVTSEGEVSSSTVDIPNATYRRFGELQYISLPADIPDIILELRGYAQGSFTLDIELHEGNELKKRQTFSGVPSATNTVVIAAISPGLSPVVLSVDYDGNGVTDRHYNTNGVVVTYPVALAFVNTLTLPTLEKNRLVSTLRLGEYNRQRRSLQPTFARLQERNVLTAFRLLVISYRDSGLLAPDLSQEAIRMVDVLLSEI